MSGFSFGVTCCFSLFFFIERPTTSFLQNRNWLESIAECFFSPFFRPFSSQFLIFTMTGCGLRSSLWFFYRPLSRGVWFEFYFCFYRAHLFFYFIGPPPPPFHSRLLIGRGVPPIRAVPITGFALPSFFFLFARCLQRGRIDKMMRFHFKKKRQKFQRISLPFTEFFFVLFWCPLARNDSINDAIVFGHFKKKFKWFFFVRCSSFTCGGCSLVRIGVCITSSWLLLALFTENAVKEKTR